MKCEMLIEEMTSMVHQWKTLKMKIGRWVHMPLTSFNTNIIHLSIAMRHRDASQHWNCICLISIKIHGVHLWSEKIGFILLIVPAARMNLVRCNNHEHNIVPCGLTAEPTIQAGFTYAGVFVVGNRGIKAEQLVVKLASDIRRIHVHGPVGHNCTKLVDKFEKLKKIVSSSFNVISACRVWVKCVGWSWGAKSDYWGAHQPWSLPRIMFATIELCRPRISKK